MPKRCEKRLFDHNRVVREKTALKNCSYSKSESILKIPKTGHNAKVIAPAKWSV